MTDDVAPATGPLSSGASTNDTNLTVQASLTGSGAVAGDTVQLYNGTGTASQMGSSYILTAADITAGFATVQTGTLVNGTTYAITARVTDQAGNQSLASASFTVTEDASAVCYVQGTRILTPAGEIPIEQLAVGGSVLTATGTTESIKWVGRREITLATHPRPETVAPIRIKQNAFAENVPHRDLLLSPDHGVYIDGKLICARQLVNGSTIRQEAGWTSVKYFHVELNAHAILLAEGLTAESYLNTGNEGFFANSGGPRTLHPNLTDETDYPTREAGSVAPFIWDEETVRPIWQRLSDRACALGQPLPQVDVTTDTELHVLVKGRRVEPLYKNNGLFIFALPPGTKAVHLVSRAGSPADARPWLEDRRYLGVYIERIVIRGTNNLQELPLDHPDLAQGWWALEQNGASMRRWTNGDALLPLPESDGITMLEISASNGGMIYVTRTNESRQAA